MTSMIDLPVAVLPIRSAAEEERGDLSRRPAEPKRFLKDYDDAECVRLEVELDSVLFARR